MLVRYREGRRLASGSTRITAPPGARSWLGPSEVGLTGAGEPQHVAEPKLDEHHRAASLYQ